MALHTLTYDQVARELGRRLHVGEDPDDWDTLTSQQMDDVILRGSRMLYFPPATMISDQALVNHNWSFIVESLSMTLSDATTYNDLPSDFVRLTGKPTIAGSEYPLEPISEAKIRALSSASSGLGDPQYYHIRRETPSSADLLYQIGVYPQPVGDKTLTGEYVFDPTVASEAQDPIVPSWAAEAYLAALYYAGDMLLNHPNVDPKLEENFKELLAASILWDKGISG